MSRFQDMLKRATNVGAEVEEAAIADFQKVIDRGEQLHRKREKATSKHLAHLDTMHAGLDGFEKSIDDYGNGAPDGPLDDGEKPSPQSSPEPQAGVSTLGVGNDGKPNASRA